MSFVYHDNSGQAGYNNDAAMVLKDWVARLKEVDYDDKNAEKNRQNR
jgi:hypothetical protein